MNVNEEQKKIVADWYASGASLDEIQKRIKAEFGVHLTYLDVRLMVAELPQPVEEAEPEPRDGEDAAAASAHDGEDAPVYDLEGDAQDVAAAPAPSQEAVPGDVEVSVDALMIPGTFASGDVTFGDGMKGKWYLDRAGRLGLDGFPEGYIPNKADGAVFQSKLMSALQAKGLC